MTQKPLKIEVMKSILDQIKDQTVCVKQHIESYQKLSNDFDMFEIKVSSTDETYDEYFKLKSEKNKELKRLVSNTQLLATLLGYTFNERESKYLKKKYGSGVITVSEMVIWYGEHLSDRIESIRNAYFL